MQTYEPKQALAILMARLKQKAPELSNLIQASIDEGKYIEKSEKVEQKNPKKHTFNKATRLTDIEAIEIALRILEAYFIEQPLFVVSLAKDLKETKISNKSMQLENEFPLFKQAVPNEGSQDSIPDEYDWKSARIDFESETQLGPKSEADFFEIGTDKEQLVEQQKLNLAELKRCFSFGDVT